MKLVMTAGQQYPNLTKHEASKHMLNKVKIARHIFMPMEPISKLCPSKKSKANNHYILGLGWNKALPTAPTPAKRSRQGIKTHNHYIMALLRDEATG